jgi:hypothetical protein
LVKVTLSNLFFILIIQYIEFNIFCASLKKSLEKKDSNHKDLELICFIIF